MQQFCSQWQHGRGGSLALATMAICLATIGHSPASAADNALAGRLDFEAANLPEAKVEIDISQDMFHDLFGIGDAAIAGVAETLMKSATGDGGKGTHLAAEQLEAARQIIQLAGAVVREVRVRAYDGLPAEAGDAQKLVKPFEDQLRAAKWETLARMRDHEKMVRVSAIRGDGAIQGIFVVATDRDKAVLVNVVCDVSPENVKKLTSAATKVGLENGLAAEIERKMSHISGAGKPPQAKVIKNPKTHEIEVKITPPTPPAPPAPAARSAEPAKTSE